MGGNQAINVNPPTGAVQHITRHGSDWLWAVFSVMALSALIVFAWSLFRPRGQRVFHHLFLIVLTTSAISYFAMASDLGFTNINTEFSHHGFPTGTTRQIWYARYIDWVITVPILLLTIVLASGLPLSDILTLIFFALVMVVSGLIGALVHTTYKWGFFAFGCAALLYIWWNMMGPARASSFALGSPFKSAFTISTGWLSFLFLLYPISWGLSEGGTVISPTSEMVFYGVLDILAKPVFAFMHLFQVSQLDLAALHLSSGKYTTSAVAEGAYDPEKTRPHGARDAAIVGTGAAGAGAVAAGQRRDQRAYDRDEYDRDRPSYDEPPRGQQTYDRPTQDQQDRTGKTGKKGIFGKKGKYDATTPATTAPGTAPVATPVQPVEAGLTTTEPAPRISEATAVSST